MTRSAAAPAWEQDAEMADLIEVYAMRLRAAGRSAYTISTRTRVLRHAERTLPQGLDGASDEEIIEYLARPTLRRAWSRATVDAHLRGYYRTMVAAGKLSLDPMVQIPRPRAGQRIPNPVTDDELRAAVQRSPDPWRGAVILASYAGLRCAEMARLDRADITDRHVRVQRGKGDRSRYVPTHRAVAEYAVGLPAGPVLRRDGGWPVTPEWLTGKQHLHWTSVGLPGVHWHRFRHWFGTTLSEQGVPIEVIQGLMGHASIETTRGYVKVAVQRHAAAVAVLPEIGTRAGR